MEHRRRRELAQSYRDGAEHYQRVRPGYPAAVVDWLVPAGSQDVADVGAGTGKLTAGLVQRGLVVRAVDPSADMLAQLSRLLPEVPTVTGTAESTGLATASADVVTVAQAWHWCDPLAASSELARVLRPRGTLGLLWNQLDTTVAWVHRFSRIIHAGDVLTPGFRPLVGPEFGPLESSLTRWSAGLSALELTNLAKSRSFYLAAGAQARTRLLSNLQWYLYDHLGHTDQDVLQLPYLTQAFRTRRLQ